MTRQRVHITAQDERYALAFSQAKNINSKSIQKHNIITEPKSYTEAAESKSRPENLHYG